MTAHPYRQRKNDRLITPGASSIEIRCDYAVAPLDRVALDMDRTWGIDRLPELVSPATAEKYGRAIAHLLECMDRNQPEETAAAAQNCIRGLQAMDREARASGHQPVTPEIWEYELDGHRFGVIREVGDWPAVAATRPGLTLYTLREVAVALAAYKSALPTIDAIKAIVPAQIIATRQRTQTEIDLEDEIPF